MTSQSLELVRDLLGRCEDELASQADAAVLKSRFQQILTPSIVRDVASEACECEAFMLAAFDAAEQAGWQWPADVLLRVGELAAHLGHLERATRIATICLDRSPGSTDVIVLWAETAASPGDTVDRYLEAMHHADNRSAVEEAARHFASHSTEQQELMQRLEAGLRDE